MATHLKTKNGIRGPAIAGAAALAAVLGVMLPAAAQAEERVCRGALGAITVDNLRVPQSATCTLDGTRVKGTAKVGRNAALFATHIRVIGNVQGENARRVNLVGSRVGGSVQVVQGRAATVRATTINGDLLYDDQSAALRAINNNVGGNIQAFQNTGGVEIRVNRVDGNLQCKANVPRPTGGGNIVQGNKEDQCARL
jgi:hypothetical protein